MYLRHEYKQPNPEEAQPPAPPPIPPYRPDDLEIEPLVPPADRRPPPPESSIMYGAPPSRNATPGGYTERPRRYHMTAAEAEICKISGIEPKDYIKGRIRLEREKKQGFRQNG